MAPSTSAPKDINSVIAGMVDRGAWKYWDTLTTTAGTALMTSYQFYSVPIGMVDPITGLQKTKLQTNMQRGNQFPPPRCLVLMRLGFEFKNMLKADIDAFLANYYYELRIDDKIFFEGLLEYAPPGVGDFGSSTNSGESAWGTGFPAWQCAIPWGEYSKYIAPLQQFSLTLTCPNTPPTLTASDVGGQGLLLVPFMDGLTDRSVQ